MAIGTVEYMSPEQVRAEEVDHRTDLFSFGLVLYEMATGRRAFAGDSPGIVFDGILNRQPISPLRLNPELPAEVEHIISKALEKDRKLRYQSAQELLVDLRRLAGAAGEISRKRERRGWVWWAWRVGVGVAMLAMLATGVWFWVQKSRATWARTVALPEAARLIEQGKSYAAFRLLRRAEAYVPDDPGLKDLLSESTTRVTVHTEPAGARVYVRDFFDEPDAWEFLGSAPLDGLRLPTATLVFKISCEGFETRELRIQTWQRSLGFSLRPVGEASPNMVHVPGGLLSTPAVELEGYWVDKYEVTNQQFKEFVGRGGYENHQF
jgi:hypothetical protein